MFIAAHRNRTEGRERRGRRDAGAEGELAGQTCCRGDGGLSCPRGSVSTVAVGPLSHNMYYDAESAESDSQKHSLALIAQRVMDSKISV